MAGMVQPFHFWAPMLQLSASTVTKRHRNSGVALACGKHLNRSNVGTVTIRNISGQQQGAAALSTVSTDRSRRGAVEGEVLAVAVVVVGVAIVDVCNFSSLCLHKKAISSFHQSVWERLPCSLFFLSRVMQNTLNLETRRSSASGLNIESLLRNRLILVILHSINQHGFYDPPAK